MSEKVFDVVGVFNDETRCSFSDKKQAENFIRKYLNTGMYVVRERKRESVYSSVADWELAKKREIEELESQIASLKIELPFKINCQSIAKSHYLSLKSAKEMKVVKIDNENVSITLPNGYNFISSYKNFHFIRKEVAELEMVKTTLEYEISKIKNFLGQKKSNSVANESEDEME